MLNEKTKSDKAIFVTLIVTESTSSFLKLDVPHLEETHPQDSNICIISASELTYFKRLQGSKESQEAHEPHDHHIEEIYLKMASDIALFSTTTDSSSSCMYEFSDETLTDTVSDSNLSGKLKAIKVYNRPMASVRTVAHASKLNVVSNDIYVSLLDTDSQSSSEIFCRICHGGESLGDLLTPCRCRGTIALVHLKCLERWLRESNHSSCELCQHHFKIMREPRYSIPWSILVFLRHPGDHLSEILLDLLAFVIYTPSAVASTYMLMMICEALVKSNIVTTGSFSSHIIAFSAVFGMAAIDFTYSSWLVMCIHKHIEAWRDWYRSNSAMKIVLPKIKMRPHKTRKR